MVVSINVGMFFWFLSFGGSYLVVFGCCAFLQGFYQGFVFLDALRHFCFLRPFSCMCLTLYSRCFWALDTCGSFYFLAWWFLGGFLLGSLALVGFP